MLHQKRHALTCRIKGELNKGLIILNNGCLLPTIAFATDLDTDGSGCSFVIYYTNIFAAHY